MRDAAYADYLAEVTDKFTHRFGKAPIIEVNISQERIRSDNDTDERKSPEAIASGSFVSPSHAKSVAFHAGEHIDAQIAVLIVTVNPLVGQVTPFEEHADPLRNVVFGAEIYVELHIHMSPAQSGRRVARPYT